MVSNDRDFSLLVLKPRESKFFHFCRLRTLQLGNIAKIRLILAPFSQNWTHLEQFQALIWIILKLFQLFSRIIGPETLEEENVKLTNGCSIKKNPLSKGQRKLKKRHEKSVIILILIVSVFLACHSFRLGLQIYQILHTDQFTKEHYDFCHQLGSLPYPTSFLIFVDFNNLFLVFNSSINFVIYCAVRKSFRERIWSILSRPFKSLARKTSFNSKKSPTTINHTIWRTKYKNTRNLNCKGIFLASSLSWLTHSAVVKWTKWYLNFCIFLQFLPNSESTHD